MKLPVLIMAIMMIMTMKIMMMMTLTMISCVMTINVLRLCVFFFAETGVTRPQTYFNNE